MEDNIFERIAKNERSSRQESAKRTKTDGEGRMQNYLSLINNLSDYMRAEGILRLPFTTDRSDAVEAHITIDGRIVATYKKGFWPLRRKETRQYHLRDLSDVLEYIGRGKDQTHLNQVSADDITTIENLIDSSVRLNVPQ